MRESSRQFFRDVGGFTLVELLVVMGIIAVLIGLLLPVLGNSRESARSVQCLSNLRQMVVACQTYAATYRGFYPPAFQKRVAGAVGYLDEWDYTIVTDSSTFPPRRTVEPGLLWMGRADLRIHQCPSFLGNANAPLNEYTGYNYNTSYIGRGEYAGGAAFDPPAKLTDVRKPEMTIVFGDGQFADGANKYMRSPLPSGFGSDSITGRHAGTQGFRHRKQTNAAFADGHAVSILDRRTAGNTSVAEGTGFISDDNELYDLR